MEITTAELKDKLLELLPKNEHSAIPVGALMESLSFEVNEHTRKNVYSRISQELKLLVDAELCKRNKSSGIYHYWTDSSMSKKPDSLLLSSKVREKLGKEGYTVNRDAEVHFVDLIYMFKYITKQEGVVLVDSFIKWFIENSQKGNLGFKSINTLTYKLRHEINHPSQMKRQTYLNEKDVPSHNHKVVHRRDVSLRNYIFQSVPLAEDQAVTADQMAFSLDIPHRRNTVNSVLSRLYLNGEILRTGRNPYRYWMNSSLLNPLLKVKSVNPTPQQELLARIKVAESDIAQIHKRYEKVEEIIQEKELNVQLIKLEQSKEAEQQKLDLLEERLKKWNAEEAKVNSGILR